MKRTSTPHTGEHRQRREQRLDGVFERRQRSVAALIIVERILESFDSSAQRRSVENMTEHLPEKLRQRIIAAALEYGDLHRAACESETGLRRFASEQHYPDTPSGLGDLLMHARTGKDASGSVTLVRKGAYFVVSCEKPQDYTALFAAGQDQLVQRAEQTSGSFHAENFTLAFEPSADGYTRVSVAGVLPQLLESVLLVKGTSRSEPEYDVIVTHERQHFIHQRVLGAFSRSEGKAKPTPLENVHRMVKDELLAYMREGSSPERIVEHIRRPVYAHLFAKLTPEEHRAVDALLGAVDHAFRSTQKVLEYPESRASFVYQLIDIPLEKFPRWVPEIAAFYRHRFDPYNDLLMPIQDVVVSELDLAFVPSARRLHSEFLRERTLHAQVCDRLQTLLFSSDDSSAIERIAQKLQKRKESLLQSKHRLEQVLGIE